jgi:hypothetical protein
MDCFVASLLAITWRRCHAGAQSRFPYSSARNFFTLSVDGMFTTFIVSVFTNTSEANAQKHAVHCL